ncbi:MAG TPA: disulfide bond formation protein DsbD, partial [Bacteroidales bacterium]|nr:disulfide bond formation protein DsbD [Bacteroidales bacterium]
AKSQNKPVLIDFSGHGCVSCRKMEESVWVDPEVLKRLKNDYIVIQLYTDDRTELPEEEWTPGDESNDGRVKQTIGEKWGDYQVRRFGRNSQPQYILLGPDGEMLIKETRGYNPDVESYIEFLDKGLEAFKEKYKK